MTSMVATLAIPWWIDINTARQMASTVGQMIFGARSTTGWTMRLQLSMITCNMVGTPIRTLRICVLMTLYEREKAGW